ncbi:MAG: LamG-like jellyroll fold domain-containing protein [Thermodesulfobacteriota bacterium]|nr:LamG-like jellyroll fold domain-containing protein [Thermodesulfobacteriota bacterium]
MKRLKLDAIFLVILTTISLSGSVVHAEFHHVDDCSVCHYAGGAESSTCTACPNNAMIKCVIDTPNSGLKDTVFGPYVWGEDPQTPYSGVCEVCHTETKFHRNNVSGDHDHYADENCIPCHRHYKEFTHSGGQPCESCHGHEGGDGTAVSHATHTAGTVPKGPPTAMACGDCHDTNNYPLFGADGAQETLAATTVCDDCHSEGGAYDGIDMAKAEWKDGVYEADGKTLKSEKKQWCITCHDDDAPTIDGRTAKQVSGNNSAYGYNISGHGKYDISCTDCHDPQFTHIDDYTKTYHPGELDSDWPYPDIDSARGYQQGYRLKSINGLRPMYMPRHPSQHPDYGGWTDPTQFALCFECHSSNGLYSMMNHFVDVKIGERYHWDGGYWGHLGQAVYWWDSDRRSGFDSAMSCPSCHDPHGRKAYLGNATFAMTRKDMGIVHKREVKQSYAYMETNECHDEGGDVYCTGCHSPLDRYYYELGTPAPAEPAFSAELDSSASVSVDGGSLESGLETFSSYTVFGKSKTGVLIDETGEGVTFPSSNLNSDNEDYGETVAFWYVPNFKTNDHEGEAYLFHCADDVDNFIHVVVINKQLRFRIGSGGTNHTVRTTNLGWQAGSAHHIVCTWGSASGMHIYLDALEPSYVTDVGLTYTGGMNQLPAEFLIGNCVDDDSLVANGIIDDFRIYGYQYQKFEQEIAFFTKLDDATAVTNPELGTGGSVSGNVVFVTGETYAQDNGGAFFEDTYHEGVLQFSTSNLNRDQETIDLWYRPRFNDTGFAKFLVYCESDANNFLGLRMTTDHEIRFVIKVASTAYGLTSQPLDSALTWYHVVATWGPGGMRLYVNDQEVDYSESSGLTYEGGLRGGNWDVSFPSSFMVGNKASGNNRQCDGSIDELRIYGYRAAPEYVEVGPVP